METCPFEVHELPRDRWETADYVLVEVLDASHHPFEVTSGRLVDAVTGDLVIGALGADSSSSLPLNEAGEVYVIYGQERPYDLALAGKVTMP